MPSAIVAIEVSGTGRPAASEAGNAAAASACTATTRTSGRRAFTAAAMPDTSPPPPVQTTTVATSGHCSSSSRPDGALPGDDVGVVERVDEHRAGLLRRTRTAATSASVRVCPPSCASAP